MDTDSTEHRRAEVMRECGAEWFTWLSAADGRCCDYCTSQDGIVRPIHELDVDAHFSACSNPLGCRCVCGPAEDSA